MDEQTSEKTDEFSRFLDAPPIWFALFVWMYPIFYSIFCIVIGSAFGKFGDPGYIFLFIFFASLMFLFSSSKWFRHRVAFMAPFWLFLLVAATSTTQGAITSAVSRAFSDVTSQLEAAEELRAVELDREQSSSETSQRKLGTSKSEAR
ncbi:hypothetical protein BH11CYA1_BH11CYA1_06090 [soil metagenome]